MRFLVASAALGAVGFWASEAFFWSAPHPDFSLQDQAATCLAYMLCASVALFVVVRSGLQGLRAAFLGGMILGFLIEGAVVGTVYDAFPFQMVWTPVAWHGLISGGVVLGLGRSGARLGPWRMALIWVGLGLFGSLTALYWPYEMSMPGRGAVLAYLMGLGLLVPLGHWALDRTGTLKTAPPWAVAGPAALLGAAWAVQGVVSLNPLRLVLPVVLAGLVWLAFRLGDRRAVSLGAAVPVWQHGLFLLAPLTVALLAPLGWARFPGGVAMWPMALLTSAVGLGWLGRLVWRGPAFRTVSER